jgi:Tol biopolymer transport system component
MHADGSGLQQISLSSEFPSGSTVIYWDSTTPAKFSPDGKHVAFSTIQNVVTRNGRPVGGNWIMLLGDLVPVSGQLRLEHMRQLNHPDPYWYEAKDFTRDGTQLIFASARGDGHGNPNLNPDVYTMNLTTGAIARYTHNPAWEETMDITPNGQFVVFNSDRANLSLGPSQIEPISNPQKEFLKVLTAKTAHHDLYLSGPQGDAGWVRRLTFDGDPNNGGWASTQPRWSPDGRSIRFQQTGNGTGVNRTMLLTFSCTPSIPPAS